MRTSIKTTVDDVDIIEPTQPKCFVSYPFMIGIMAALQVLTVIFGGFITGATVGFSALQIWHFSLDSFLARSIIMLFLLPFARVVIWFIQYKVEKVVGFDYKKDFKLFKFGINPSNSVQFNARSYRKIC